MSLQNAHKLSDKLNKIGVKTLTKNFYNEFVIEVKDADKILSELKKENILGGIKLDNNKILVSTTEMITDEDIDKYVEAVSKL